MALPKTGTLGQIVQDNGYNYQWTGVGWKNIGQASITIGNTTINANGFTSGNTTVGSNGVNVGNTSISGNGVSVGNTSLTSNGFNVGNTSIGSNGVNVGNTSLTSNGFNLGNTFVGANGFTSGNTSVSSNGFVGNTSVGNSSITGNSISTGNSTSNTAVTGNGVNTGNSTTNTAITGNGVATGNSTSNTFISGNSIIIGTSNSTATINSSSFTGTANDSLRLGGVLADYYINTSANYVITGIHTYNANLNINRTILINGNTGSTGQVLTSNGAGNVYWSTASTNATSQSFTGDGTTTAFVLTNPIANQNNVIISLNGLTQVPVTHYVISGSALTFTTAPYLGSIIEARSIEGVAFVSGGSGSIISSGDYFLSSMLLGGM